MPVTSYSDHVGSWQDADHILHQQAEVYLMGPP